MSRVFSADLARIASAMRGGVYSAPWYLVVGEPLVGKSAFIRSMNLTWTSPQPVDGQFGQAWIASEVRPWPAELVNFSDRSLTCQLMPAMPTPLLPTAPMVPATCVP